MKKSLIGIVIIILILVVCFAAYHFFSRTISTSLTQPTQSTKVYQSMRTQPTVMASNSVYKIMPSGKLGPIFTDTTGRTLYINKNDKNGVSTCIHGCLKAWPAYVASSQNGNFPENITVIKRTDGGLQYAWKGKPLYYFANDKQLGQVNGEGIGGVWSVVK